MTTITNLFTNPSAETDLSNILAVSSTLTRVAAQAASGTYAVEVVCSGSATQQGIAWQRLFGSVLTGPYRASLSLVGSGTVSVYLRIVYTDATNTSSTPVTATLTGSPQRVNTASVTADGAKTVNYMNLYTRTTTAQAVTFYGDAALLVQGTTLPAYFDGDSPNADWTGTPHASTSVLTIPRLFPVLKIGTPHIGPLKLGQKG